MTTIRHAYIEVTRNCNEKCLYCYNDSGKPLKHELSSDEFAQVLTQFHQQGGSSVMFTGGEALMRYDIANLVYLSRQLGFTQVGLSTNGLLLSKERGRDAVSLCNEVDISLDGFAGTHDFLRGVRSWERTVEAIKLAGKLSPWVHINACLSKELWDNLDTFLNFLLTLGVKSVKFAKIGHVGRARSSNNLSHGLPDDNTLYEALESLVEIYRMRIRITHSLSRTMTPISISTDGCVITPDGLIFPQLGLTAPEWSIGQATPTWFVNNLAVDKYQEAMQRVTNRGQSILEDGGVVEWWRLINDEMTVTNQMGHE